MSGMGPAINAAVAALNASWRVAGAAAPTTLILIEAAEAAALAIGGDELNEAERRFLWEAFSLARASLARRVTAVDLVPPHVAT